MRNRRKYLGLTLLATLLIALALRPERPEQATVVSGEPPTEDQLAAGDWIYLSDLPWVSGTTGWVAMANDDLPSLDGSFNGGGLAIGGRSYAKGIGVYPLSEIQYQLDGQYTIFGSDVGLNDLAPDAAEDTSSRVVFAVYLDGALAYDSGVVTRRQLPKQVQLPIAGVRELRLVVSAAGPPSNYNFAAWAGARLLRSPLPIDAEIVADNLAPLVEQVAWRSSQRVEDRQFVARLARAEQSAVDAGVEVAGSPSVAAIQLSRGAVLLRNDFLALSYGVGGAEHGLLTALHIPTGRLLLYRADASITTDKGQRWSMHYDTKPGAAPGYRLEEVADPVFGGGKRLIVELAAKTGEERFRFSLTLFDRRPYFTQQITVDGLPAETALRVNHVDSLGPSNLAIADGLRYLTDITRLRSGVVQDDGLQHRETVDQGKPVFLYGEGAGLGLVLARLDESVGPAEVAMQVDPGRVLGRLDMSTGPQRTAQGSGAVAGPRLYVEAVTTGRPAEAFANFRDVLAKLYPPAPLPDWVRYQWLSWYTYYMDIDEQRIRRQIDYIADNLADLGPWHIIVDAGWYVAEGRPDADWRNVDRDKFPSGLRALVDYAHLRNVKVVLYFSAPYLDSRAAQGDWLGLRGLIDKHPDWLIRLGEDYSRQSFVYDLENPELRAYLAEVMRDYFFVYDVDGIKIDGLGNGDGATLSPGERDAFGLVGKVLQPVLDIYRLVHDEAMRWEPEAYIESGWLDPLFAAGLAHTFRYGDENMSFSNRYPQPGLLEHIDYAIAQQSYWGQRANMGAVYAEPNDPASINEQWLAASLALGAQSVLAFDLPSMSNDTLSRYRSLLVHYRPFTGQTVYATVPGAEVFATIKDGLAFVGLLNRDGAAHDVDLPLRAVGLSDNKRYLAYDVREEQHTLTEDRIAVKLEPRSFRMFVLRDQPGLIWTNSAFSSENGSQQLALTVRGPAQIAGFAQVLAPELRGVTLDGQPLRELPASERLPGYSYDARLGLLTVRYDHDRPHRIVITYGGTR